MGFKAGGNGLSCVVFGGLWATLGGSGLMLRVRLSPGPVVWGGGLLCVGYYGVGLSG